MYQLRSVIDNLEKDPLLKLMFGSKYKGKATQGVQVH